MLAVAANSGAQTPVSPAVPRTLDGKPDLSGIWQVINTAAWDIQDHSAQKGVPAGPHGLGKAPEDLVDILLRQPRAG